MSNAKNDDFLQQILEAETQAKRDTAKAQKAQGAELANYEKKLEAKNADVLDTQREKAREQIKDRQALAKKNYEKMIIEGKREAETLEKELEGKIEKQMPLAQSYLVTELL